MEMSERVPDPVSVPEEALRIAYGWIDRGDHYRGCPANPGCSKVSRHVCLCGKERLLAHLREVFDKMADERGVRPIDEPDE